MNNKARKAVSNAIGKKADEVFTGWKSCPNGMFGLVKGIKIESKNVGGR